MTPDETQPLPVLQARSVGKSYPAVTGGAPEVRLFHDLTLSITPGEMVAIVGESGAGKSSLLHLLAALDAPSSGSVLFGETDVTRLSPRSAATYRNRDIGYVWQFHYLMPEFSALENVALPLLAAGTPRPEALRRAATWLVRVGLSGREHHRSGELSGGEQQRVSIARALVSQPRLLLADEPTGDLDTTTAEAVFDLLQQLCRQENLAAVLVTHNLDFARRCDRVLRLSGGTLHPA